MWDFLGAGIGGVLGSIANIVSSGLNVKMQRETNAMNERLANQANAANVHAPVTQFGQMTGLGAGRAAALGALGAPGSASAATMQSPQVDGSGISDGLTSAVSSILQAKQLKQDKELREKELKLQKDVADANVRKINADADLAKSQSRELKQRNYARQVVDQILPDLVLDKDVYSVSDITSKHYRPGGVLTDMTWQDTLSNPYVTDMINDYISKWRQERNFERDLDVKGSTITRNDVQNYVDQMHLNQEERRLVSDLATALVTRDNILQDTKLKEQLTTKEGIESALRDLDKQVKESGLQSEIDAQKAYNAMLKNQAEVSGSKGVLITKEIIGGLKDVCGAARDAGIAYSSVVSPATASLLNSADKTKVTQIDPSKNKEYNYYY